MVRRTAELSAFDIIEFYGTKAAGKSKHGDDGHTPVGMTPAERKEALRRFREPGHRLLISTSASEEGIDIKFCQVSGVVTRNSHHYYDGG